jgi:methylmalonyl-CoA mutase
LLKPVYTAADIDGLPHLGAMPGEVPFVRGPYRTMYTQKPWTIRQYAGYAGAEDSNSAFRTALDQGGQGLSVAFDLPTHRGYDSDHELARADVGMAGVAIDSVEDMKALFAGIALDRVSVSMTMSGAVLPVLAAFIVAAEEAGIPAQALSGTIQNDILKEFMVRNTYIFAPEPSMRMVAEVVEYVAQHLPRFNAISISGYHFQEAGADAVLELALTLANARAYVRAVQARGLDIDAFCGQLSFFFGVGTDFYVEIAKLRAARLLWCEMVEALGGTTTKAKTLRTHCQTSGWSLAAQESNNNVVRTTVEAMAAVLGGTQSLHTNAFDEALTLPTEASARLARNTQLILQHETGICDVVDPWAGSYLMESLTSEIADRVRQLLQEIEARGGVIAALCSGWVAGRIHEAATRTQARIDNGERVVVGVNRYPLGPEVGVADAVLHIDGDKVRERQLERLAALRASRSDSEVKRALQALTASAQSGEGNLLALTIAAVRARATVGECIGALEQIWPRHHAEAQYTEAVYGDERSKDDEWQTARASIQQLATRIGRTPRVLIAKIGQDGHDRGAKVIAAALSDAGFEVLLGPLFQTPQQVVAQALREQVDLVGVSSLVGAHLDLLPEVVQLLRQHVEHIPVFAGGVIPESHTVTLKEAGVAAVFGPGSKMEDIVARIVESLSLPMWQQKNVHGINAPALSN